MTGTCPDLLAALRTREQDLMTLAAGVRARLEEVRDMIARLNGNPRKRTRRPDAERSQHVPGAAHTPFTVTTQPSSPDELFPDPQDTPESAQ